MTTTDRPTATRRPEHPSGAPSIGGAPTAAAGGERRLRLLLAYDGGPYSGFARQRDRRTVQGELEAALSRLAHRPVVSVGAGRTDAGVHARGQVVHADVPDSLDPERMRATLNAVLGPAIVVRDASWAAPGFDARFSARRRTYVYRIDDSPCPDPLRRHSVLHHRHQLDVDRMRAAAEQLVGEHDFASFCRSRGGATTTRRLREVSIERDADGIIAVTVVADAFCHQMVRSIVGHLLAVGDGHRDPAATAAILAARDRGRAGNVAPPHGLVLESVSYDDTSPVRVEV
jgi:tRNA pseudouridine38-40 synthase